MMVKESGLPELATAPTASSVSENSSLANLPAASSNGQTSAGTTKATIKNHERANARRRSKTLADTGRPRQEIREGGAIAAFSGVVGALREHDPTGSCRGDQEP